MPDSTETCPHCKQPLVRSIESRANAVATRCGLTDRQSIVLRMILEHQDRCGSAPTLGYMATVLQRSRVSVHETITACVTKGAIERDKYKKQGLKVIESF